MKGWFIALVLCLLFMSALPSVAFAHSGGTDANGGHYNHSTGEYHYHHGYSAHSHYDMDSDGVADCPFDFKDNTDHSSGSSQESSGKASSLVKERARQAEEARKNAPTPAEVAAMNPMKDLVPEGSQKHTEAVTIKIGNSIKIQVPKNVYDCVVSIGAYLIIPAVCLAYACVKTILKKIKTHRSNKKVLETLGLSYIKLPKNVMLLANGIPSLKNPDLLHPYGEYTVYTAKHGKSFHTRQRCCKNATAAHIFSISTSLTPCRRCAKNVQYPVVVPQWYTEIKKKQDEI